MAFSCGGSIKSTTLAVALVKGLVNTVNANGVFVVVVRDVAVLAVLLVRGRDKLLGIDCTQIPINWNCHGGIYLELQFLKIET